MGTTVIGGTAAASLIAIFLIPVTFYVVVMRLHGHKVNKDRDDRGEKEGQDEGDSHA